MKLELRPALLSTCVLSLTACFGPSTSDDATETATETAGDGDGDPGDGDGDPGDGDGDGDPGDGDGDGDGDAGPPEFVSFTVNASVNPGVVEAASGVIIEAEITDPDMDLDYVVFQRDGEQIAMFVTPGPNFVFEWVVSGTELDGTYELSAAAYDSDDNMAVSDPISLTIAMPDGGTEVVQWDHDGGTLDALYGLDVDADGTNVVLTGQTEQAGESRQRTDRVVGPVWSDTVEDTSIYGAAVTARDDGGYFVAGAIPKPNNKLDSALYHYDVDGTLLDSLTFNASSQLMDDIDNTIAMQRAPGGVLVMGAYYPSGGPHMNNWVTYVHRYTDALDQVWAHHPSEDLGGRAFAYDFDAATDGSYVLGGGQFEAMPIQPWFGVFDPAGTLVEEVEINDFSGGVIHAVAYNNDGSLVIGGQVTINGDVRSWVRSYDADLGILSESMPMTPLGVVAAVAVDPFGEVVTVATEYCALVGIRYESCDLVVRKYDASGGLMWEQPYPGGGFLGPNLALLGFDASIDIDRFGYIYITAIAYDVDGTDWWARKLNP
jgi:hypothetical protein